MKTTNAIAPLARAGLLAAAVSLALPALAADVRIQGSHRKTQVKGERTSYRLVEKGGRLTATVKGPGDLTVMLHAELKASGNAAASLFLDKKKIHFVDLKGAPAGALSTGGSAGPLRTEVIKIPPGSHEVAIEPFGGAAVAFRMSRAGGSHDETAGTKGKKGSRHKQAQAAPAPVELAAEPIATPPAEAAPAAPSPATPPAPAATAAATPAPAPPPPAAAAPPAEEGSLMMGEPPPKPAAEASATPPPEPAPAPAPAAETPPAAPPAPAEATSTTTVEVDKTSGKRSAATYWLAGTALVLAGGAVALWGVSSIQDSNYQNAVEATNGTAANPARGSMLSTANTELTIAEIVAGAAAVALATSAVLAW
ncbi:MAG TPA: hypothetical protein VMB50_04270 [Myxococcales bacterium]|nr:hypothetical protein [Myxococcales bacterium]